MALGASIPAHADSVTGSIQNGYGRLSFDTASRVSATATDGVLAISFSARTDISPATIMAAMPRAITGGHADSDGKTLRFVLAQPLKLHVSQVGNHAVVDLATTDFTGTMPDLVAPPPPRVVVKPVNMASLPEIKLRTGAYSKFTRLVFDWPRNVSYQIFPGAGKITIRFGAPARADVSALAHFAPPWVKNASWRLEGQSTIVEFETDSDSGYHDFKDGTHVVLDILAPKTDGSSYAPPGIAKPVITAMTAAQKSGVSQAQAQAVVQASWQLAGAPAAKPAPAKPDTKTADAAHAKPQPQFIQSAKPPAGALSAPVIPVADARRTRDGAVITFKVAGTLPAAVFVRGLTAWVVLENAPAFDSGNLKSALGDFAASIEASSSDGLGILRITLAAPAEIAARRQGAALQVEIAPNVAPAPTAINFARNQADPRRASLSTLLPGADHVFKIQDPSGGDLLTVIPAQVGQGLRSIRYFADFTALPSAAGMVITPWSDDLQVTVDMSRVSIARPAGLALTPPQLPVAMAPASLARFGDGPSYFDFNRWRQASGGSFLATERRLTQSAVHASPEVAAQARLNLARFYLANGFAAETLGLLNLVEQNDPALVGDAHLVTMRAVADYTMGRYHDAHNDLASPAFDADRHAALWRGLTEASLEDWKEAHAHLEQALPVLNRYPPSWRAAATLADVESTLGMGRPDMADAALHRLAKTLDARQALEAELDQARLLAAENRYSAAAGHFWTVEKGGDERLAAQAIFYHTGAALNAGAITASQAMERLEKLRFRWRGDGLELKTLRKLASLYFGRGQWRDGLKTLRVATQNFGGQDATRIAQDDMRSAFVNLFLKGGADKMKPVEALALFYDNLDLTPIGPDGDEMIRRMSERLITVDLLGPAENLLAYQVDKRLEGIAKAQVATRLAGIYLMDHKADKAVATIRDSQITGLPDDEAHNRLILEARAFAALKQWDNALDLVAVDKSADTRQLRADIYWESGNWAVAGQKAEELLDARWSDGAPLSESERDELMRAAVAYSLANDDASLARLRTHFMPKMNGTSDAGMFAVLSADIDQHGLAFRDAAARIASVDTLQSFMKDFSSRKSGAKI
jgi:hypothetical protein